MPTPILPMSIALHHIQTCFHYDLFHVIFTPPPNGDEQPPTQNQITLFISKFDHVSQTPTIFNLIVW
jgi:hypothetical protein